MEPSPSRCSPQAATTTTFGKLGPWIQVCNSGRKENEWIPPGRLSCRDGAGRWPGSLCKGLVLGAGLPGLLRPSSELGRTRSRSPRSVPLRSWARRQTSGLSRHRRARGGAGHKLQSSGTRGLAATPEPFPGLRQVLDGQGPEEEGLPAPSRSWRKSAARAR